MAVEAGFARVHGLEWRVVAGVTQGGEQAADFGVDLLDVVARPVIVRVRAGEELHGRHAGGRQRPSLGNHVHQGNGLSRLHGQ